MGIGSLAEKSLHAALKTWYAQPGDQLEVSLDGFVIDIVRGDLLIEIQTRNFGALKRKLTRLIENHPVRLIHPIPETRWIVHLDADGQTALSRRKSPRRGSVYHIFNELIRIPHLMVRPNFSLEVLLIQDEELRLHDGQGSWRRKGQSIADRRLLNVVSQTVLTSPADCLALLPPDLPQPFTNRDLATLLKQPPRIAQRMTYCLRAMDTLHIVGKRGNSLLYQL